ncbi:transcriptional initiation protein Tat [Hahella sp. CCB-MM4]|uniref:PhoX family protein n=1 Tax=Hahella sp. (strain CCB-MM4) TaxID=1926491 RepID=UPI000B9AE32A|nr:PhoX family phosphatase [Hahella sp. CCB-MM4]OZG69793.1 transcriptional initiation protein Tat [Hahella sp. CCB-MM4]
MSQRHDLLDFENTPRLEETEFSQLADAVISRRKLLGAGMAISVGSVFALSPVGKALAASSKSMAAHFEPIAASTADTIVLPKGYNWDVLVSWGDPLFTNAPEFDPSGTCPAADQEQQFGDNNDGMSLFPLSDDRAVMAINNEYTNYEYLFDHQGNKLTMDDVLKAQYAHGVSVFEIRKGAANRWSLVKDSKYNRRIHVQTEMELTGPAAGHDLLKTAADTSGKKVFGTMNNCSNGQTPWGTYLTCEENFNGYFGSANEGQESTEQKLYGIKAKGAGYNWHKHDDRFDFAKNPNEPHRFGWVVEIDPMDPNSKPMKRTALGRFKHENAALHVNKDGHVVVYLGDDERGEHLYKFVSKGKYNPSNQSANRSLLEEGTLYVAQFTMTDGKGQGKWIELTHGKNGLTSANGFADQAEVLIFARKAAKQVGATTMDRPEWVAVHPSGSQAYCTLTNNKNRGKEGQPVGGPNPREKNHYGQILRWTPANGDHTNHIFEWDLFAVAGNPDVHSDAYAGSANINKGNMFNSPDGIGFDKDGRLWIQTDGNYKNEGDFAGMGNNQMLCADPDSGEIKRFLVGPVACEITGLTFSPDHRTMFIGIQHPGEDLQASNFPQGGNAKPRSSVVMITREDGGVIGA